MMLSGLFRPARTFATGSEAEQGARDGHTTWVDLLMPEVLAHTEFTVSRITDDVHIGNDLRMYRVRWAGYDQFWDTWETGDTMRDTQALERYEAEGADLGSMPNVPGGW